MDFRYLRYFIAVAEELNFTKAAERLHTVQPSLSQQIRRLEEIIGVPLFVRGKHRVELTEAGRVFLEDSRRMLTELEESLQRTRRAARHESGLMTIGFIPGAEMKVFPHILPILRASLPDLELSLRSLSSPQQVEALYGREINLGFLRGPIPFPEIASSVVMQEEIVVLLSSDNPLSKKRKIQLQDLNGLRFIGISREVAPTLHELTVSLLERSGVKVKSVLPSENVLTSLSGVASGMGFTFLPDYVEQILPPKVVMKRLDLVHPPVIDLLVAYRKDDHLPALAFFLSLISERFDIAR